MRVQFRKGLGFGLTSGVITTVGLIVGLDAGTGSRLAVIAGILVIAIADALSDALGIHISEESVNKNTRQVWEATIATFLCKFFFALTFVVPFLLVDLTNAIYVCLGWGLFLIVAYSYHLAKKTKMAPHIIIAEHVILAILVVIASYLVGKAAAWLVAFY
jgi:VIT1/CCC1 family predicted Fe2+/Mn2+ transporter